MTTEQFGVTLYSEPGYKGASFHLPDERTYALRATGLDKISSIKVTNRLGEAVGWYYPDSDDAVYTARLYIKRPGNVDGLNNPNDKDVTEDTPDLGDWKERAQYVRAWGRPPSMVEAEWEEPPGAKDPEREFVE